MLNNLPEGAWLVSTNCLSLHPLNHDGSQLQNMQLMLVKGTGEVLFGLIDKLTCLYHYFGKFNSSELDHREFL